MISWCLTNVTFCLTEAFCFVFTVYSHVFDLPLMSIKPQMLSVTGFMMGKYSLDEVN